VSGDVTVAGGKPGLEQLGMLLSALGKSDPGRSRTVVVPGNHDVIWGTKPDSQDRYRHFLDAIRAEGYVTPLLEGIDISPADGRDLGATHNPCVDLGGAVLFGMNSSNYCGSFESLGDLTEEDLEALESSAKENNLISKLLARFNELRLVDICKISKGQMDALTRRIRDLDNDGRFRLKVVVLHHQLLPVSLAEEVKPYETMTNLGYVRQWLADQGVHLVLHGHKHSPGTYVDFPGAPPYIGPGQQLGRGFVMVSSVGTATNQMPVEIARLIEIESSGEETISLSINAVRPTYSNLRFSEEHFTEVAHALVSKNPVEPRVRLFEGATIDDVYSQLLASFPTDSYETESDTICRVVKGDTCNRLPIAYPVPDGENSTEWFDETVKWWQNPEPKLRVPQFNHGERIWKFASNVNQFDHAVKALESNPSTSRSVMILIDPQSYENGLDVYPSLCLVQLRIPAGTGRLDCIGYFRKQQMRAWWPINVGELASIQKKAIASISGIVPGEIVTISALAFGGSDRPRVVVPRIDRWSQDQSRMLWKLALDTLNPSADVVDELKQRWESLFSDWRPGPRMERDGVPLALSGLDVLADAVETCAFTFPNAGAAILANELRDVSRINHAYWSKDSAEPDNGSRLSDFSSWQLTVNRAIDRVLERSNEVASIATGTEGEDETP